MSRRSDSVHSIHPLNLLSPSRLDLVCKYLYFRQLLTSADANDADGTPAAQMYEKHIAQRTGGLEPQDPFQADPSTIEKLSVADYVRHAGLLLASMKERGFDAGGAVTYCPNGTLGNGAHRISAALAPARAAAP